MTDARAEASYEPQLVADGDSRWLDLFSAAFFQLDQGDGSLGDRDGAFKVKSEDYAPLPYNAATFDYAAFEPLVFEPLGSGGDVFPNEADFQGDYAIRFDDAGLTGVGTELAPITGATLGFATDMADNDSLSGNGYETVVDAVSGFVTLVNGEVAAMNGVIDVTLYDDFSNWGLPMLEFPGSLTLQGSYWEFYADGANFVDGFDNPMRLVWDAHGEVRGLPESRLPGDYNADGVVDGADYAAWRDQLDAPAGALPNDVNGGPIDASQYETWRVLHGVRLSTETAAAAAPEPSAMMMLGLAALAFGSPAISRARPSADPSASHPAPPRFQ